MLQLNDIHKRFGPTVALAGVSLSLRRGEVHALIGENGAGKSTLMNILAGGLKPDSGRMTLAGATYKPASPLDARRHGIALIHQELCLCPHLSVTENILLGMELSRGGWIDQKACLRKAEEVLETFNHPEIHPSRRVADLPIAARQVVEICRAIAAKANIILMDEPTSSLQREDVDHLFKLIRELRSQQISVIYISHFLEEIREIADSYTVLRDGRSVSAGSLQGTANNELITHMVGRPVENIFPARSAPAKSSPVLEVRNLAAPGVKAANFDLRPGEILGIAGLMGAGRTELVRALFGLAPVKAGEIRLGSRAVSPKAQPADRILQRVGYLSEDRKGEGLAVALSIADNITLTRFSSCARGGWINLDKQQAQAQGWIERVGVRAFSTEQPVSTLSGGNQQKVALARLLHQDADILLLDEPTRGIDIGSKGQIYELIAKCAADNKAILMVSSYLPELFGLCDRLAVMSRGVLSEVKPISAWTPESVMQAAISADSESLAVSR